jgi:predicted aldo/keto reductase-like oxidoreductase
MSTISRRRFLTSTSLAAGAAVFAGRFALAEQPATVVPSKGISGTDLVSLGKTGIKTSVLGIGTGMSGGREVRTLGQDSFVRMVREAYDRGIRFIDTALAYRTHPFVAAALKELPRDEMFVVTKTDARQAENAKADLERLRKELGVETVDSLLIHCMTRKQWPVDMRPVIDVLLEAKQKGQIRTIGVSCHSLDALTDSVDCDAIDVHLVRINPFRKQMDGSPEDVSAQIKRMHDKGRGVLGMKIYGEGALKSREQRLASLKYVLGLGTVPAFTIGFNDIKQIDETLQLIREATA